MKRICVIVMMMLVMVSLAACGGMGASSAGSQPATAGSALDTSYGDALPVMSQLALGTLQVEGTDNAVAAEQAVKLLPLWQALRGVLSSPNPAQAEIDALLKQIESGMTAEQIAAIRDMQLTQASLVAWAQSSGVSLGGAFGPGGGLGGPFSPELRATLQAGGEVPPEIQATLDAFRAQGGFGPGEGQGPGGAFSPGLRATIQAGGELPPELQATIEARRAQGGFVLRGDLSPETRATLQAQGGPGGFRGAGLPIIDRLIEMLAERAKG